jgi:hypothetical protein
LNEKFPDISNSQPFLPHPTVNSNNPYRTHGCKWSLLKVREGKYKREHDDPGGIWKQRECVSVLQVPLKLTLT